MVTRAFYYGFFADGRTSLVEIERTLVSGGVYRVGGQWFFTVDF